MTKIFENQTKKRSFCLKCTTLFMDLPIGSIASNTIFPGGSGQEPHIDYPYWDYYNKEHWPNPPKHKDIPFYMNLQILIPLGTIHKLR